MTVHRDMAEWRATRVTREPCPCLSRFFCQSRPSRLSQASAIAAEAFMNNAGYPPEQLTEADLVLPNLESVRPESIEPIVSGNWPTEPSYGLPRR